METLSRQRLQVEAWGYAPSTLSRAVDTTIQRLRARLERDPGQPRHFVTVFGAGYRFVPLPDEEPEAALTLGECVVDLGRLQASWPDGRSVALSPQEAGLLRVLAEHGGRVVSRAELMRWVWQDRSGRATRAVDNCIMRLRARLEPEPRRPRFLKTVRGAGYRLDITPAARPVRPRDASVPLLRRSFLGRADDQRALSAALSMPGLVTLQGPGGIGKTSLALRLAADRPAIFCDLSQATDAQGLLQAAARALAITNLPPGGVAEHAAAIADHLADHGVSLLILDNLEQVVEAARPILARWLSGAGPLRILVTSRRRLLLPEERVIHLGPLPPDVAVSLFEERFEAAGGQIERTAETAAVIGELVERLDGLPLAIELAAARGRLLSPAGLLARLEQRLSLLKQIGPIDNPRHATMRAAIAWSWELLSEAEQAALAWCGVWAGGFGLEAAEEVLPVDGWVLDVLGSLQDHSLVVPCPSARPGEVRLRLLESIRVFALEQLDRRQERADAEARHASYYAALARDLITDEQLEEDTAASDRLFLDHAEFQVAASRSIGQSWEDAGWCSCAIMPGINRGGAHQEAIRQIQIIQPHVSPGLQARLVRHHGIALLGQGRYPEAIEVLQRGTAYAEAAGDELTHAQVLGTLGSALSCMRDWDASLGAYRDGVALAGRQGAPGLRAMLETYQGAIELFRRGNVAAAQALFEDAIVSLGPEGFTRERAFVYQHRGNVDLEIGRYGSAIHYISKAIAALEDLRDAREAMVFRGQLAQALQLDGQQAAAEAVIAQIGPPESVMVHGYRRLILLVVLGQTHAFAGRWRPAEALLRAGLELRHARQHQEKILFWLAVCCAAQGRAEETAELLDRAQQLPASRSLAALHAVASAWCALLLAQTPAEQARCRAEGAQVLSRVSPQRAANGLLLRQFQMGCRVMMAKLSEAIDTGCDSPATQPAL